MSFSCPPKFLCMLSCPSPYKQFNLCLWKAKKIYVADAIRASSDVLMKCFTDATSCLYPIWFILVNFWSPDFPSESSQQNPSSHLDLILTRMASVLPCESCTSTFWSFLGLVLQHFYTITGLVGLLVHSEHCCLATRSDTLGISIFMQ